MTDQTTNQPWRALYPNGLGATLEVEQPTGLSTFRAAVARRPDAVALIYFNRVISYRELDGQSDAVAVWLQEQGVGAGDRVAVVTHNIPAFPILCLAAWKLSAVAVPGNPAYRAAELGRILGDAEPRAVLCQDTEAEEVAAAVRVAGLGELPFLIASPRAGQPFPSEDFPPPSRDASVGERLEDVVERFSGRSPTATPPGPDDLAIILYTSGTTGVPKGAMLLHRNIAFNGQLTRDWVGLDADDRVLAVAPFFHVTGLICHIAAAFSAGCPMILNYRFEPGVVLDMIRRHRPTFAIGAITAFNALSRREDATAADMASLTKVYSGGAPIPPALREAITARLGFEIGPAYGMTELTSPAVFTPPGVAVPVHDDVLAIGVPMPSTEVRIVGDDGAVLPNGEVGELLVRGPQVMKGYWRKPEETAAALAGGWMHTGDLAVMDDQGWLYLVDRKKDVIIASGFKVWPREVEDVLYAHPAVREAAVVGVPDDYRGENVKACVSLVAGARTDEAALIAHCRERLTSYKAPRIIQIMDDLPKTITGKIQRAALRDAPGPGGAA